jgi:hypothetical protein
VKAIPNSQKQPRKPLRWDASMKWPLAEIFSVKAADTRIPVMDPSRKRRAA